MFRGILRRDIQPQVLLVLENMDGTGKMAELKNVVNDVGGSGRLEENKIGC